MLTTFVQTLRSTPRARDLRRLSAALAACAGAAAATGQTVYTYTGPLDGDWNNALNWNPAGIPGSGPSDVAVIAPGGRVAHAQGGPLSRTLNKLEIGAGGRVEMRNDFDMVIRGQSDGLGNTGIMTIPGTLLMSSLGNATDLTFLGSTYVTFGGGTPSTPALIEMSNSTQNRIFGAIGNERLDIQPAATIRGAGQIGLNQLSISNQGTILARGNSGLTIDPNANGVVNTGVLGADTGPLTLASGTFNNTGGQIKAIDGDVLLVNADVSGGVITSTGGAGAVRAGNAGGSTTLHDLTNTGLYRQTNDLDIYAYGLITNNGTMRMESVGNATDIYVGPNLTINGSGTLEMSNTSQNRIFDPAGNRGYQFINSGSHTIIGSGQIGLNTINVVNQGGASILAQGSDGLTIDPAVSVTNQGVMGAVNGGKLYLTSGAFNMVAPVVAQDGGIVFLNGGSFTGTYSSLGAGECRVFTLGGTTVLTNLTNTGTLRLYNDYDAGLDGTLTNNGTFALLSVGNQTDLYVNSNVTLAGTGAITMSNSTENRILDAAGNRGLTLTNSSNITGAGQIGLNSINVVNAASGVITAAGNSGLYIDPATTLVNNGAMRADSGSRLEFRSATYTFNTPVTALNNGLIAFNGGTYSGRVASEGTGSASVVSLGAATVFDGLINFGRINLNNDNDVALLNTFDNRGTFNMNSVGNATDVYIHSDVNIIGGGTISMSNTNQNNFYDSAGNRGLTLTNSANTITGAGRIGLNTINFVNGAAGVVDATLSSGIEFVPASTFTNNGSLRASNGSFLRFLAGTYQFNQPAIAGDGGRVLLAGGTYSGQVGSEGTGEVQVNSYGAATILTSFTNLGTLAIPNDFDFGVAGSIVNQGTIAFRSVGNATDMYITANTTLSGDGMVTMSNTNQNNIYDPAGNRGFTFTNASTITGSGRIGLNTINLVNAPQGHIIATQSTAIEIDAVNSVTNQGELRASGGNIFVAPVDILNNTGSIIADAGRLVQVVTTLRQTAGLTLANGEVQCDIDAFQLQGGMIAGTGRIDSNLFSIDGVVSPGTSTNTDVPSAGVLTIEGNFNQSQTGETFIEVGGPTAGSEYDRVVVTGTANTGGTLRIRLTGDYAPLVGTTFDILTATSIIGGYDTITAENIPFNNQLNVVFLADRIRVIFEIRCLGDYDGDGGITGADVSAFFADYEEGAAASDLDQDGGITGADIAEFFTRYEFGC